MGRSITFQYSLASVRNCRTTLSRTIAARMIPKGKGVAQIQRAAALVCRQLWLKVFPMLRSPSEGVSFIRSDIQNTTAADKKVSRIGSLISCACSTVKEAPRNCSTALTMRGS